MSYVSHSMSSVIYPSRNLSGLSLFFVFMHVCMVRVQGFESSVNKDLQKKKEDNKGYTDLK